MTIAILAVILAAGMWVLGWVCHEWADLADDDTRSIHAWQRRQAALCPHHAPAIQQATAECN